ncbi:MAG: lipoprotein-releasing ABC transporter permease subunit [Gammaproteobacteria bacterium]|jgi:lipoprotein-releasing system permease protein|nr:lipoprotein-releasing ABC transporter permease subunit [Gammaproteobacteria bacterium]|tara:strand:+ start:1306 stop:2565 length:1260 start_codon:yes stop_codon:yes gene_type:complete
MNSNPSSFARYIALRYVSVGKRSQLVSFMSAISIFGLALGIAILITVLSVMNGFDREMRENILGIVPHITINSDENLSIDAWLEIQNLVNDNPQIVSAAPVINTLGVVVSDAGNKGVLVNGIDAGSETSVSAIDRFMQAGSLEILQNKKWGLVLGQGLANRLGLALGDQIDLFSPVINLNPITPLATFRSFEVVGIFRVGTQELDSELVIINIDAARALFRLRTPFNGLRLRTVDVLEADAVRASLLNVLPAGSEVRSWTSQFGSIYENIKFSRNIISFMLWLLVGVAAFNLVVSLIMIVRDKTADIAILRTLGASPRIINRVFMWQGGFIALLGIVIGVAFGIFGSLQITAFAAFIERQFSVQLLSAEVYPIDFLPSQLSYVDIIIVIFGVMVLSLLATIYPARRAAAIQPAAALRTE